MRARRLEILDEYVEDDEAVVFVDGQVVALSALATTALSEQWHGGQTKPSRGKERRNWQQASRRSHEPLDRRQHRP